MRFSRLALRRYGHFDDCTLDFPAAAVDFHLVFGANEAGKSTTLAAVNDLLFGFPARTPYNFRFESSLLRVGAVVESKGTALSFWRRKGNRNTLLDDTEAPVPEAGLQSLLHGMTAEQFRVSSSLDHRRLREGGRAMMDPGHDAGQKLFAAASGIADVHAVLGALKEEAEAIWSPRASARRRYWIAQAACKEAEERLKKAMVRPTAWVAARDKLAHLAETQTTLEAARATCQAELKVLQRIRRLAGPVQKRAMLVAALPDAASAAFDADDERVFAAALATIEAAELKRRVASEAVAELQKRIAELVIDDKVLDCEGAIDALVSAAGAAEEQENDLPVLEADLRALEADVNRLAAELSLPPMPLASLQDQLPSRLALADLQTLAAARHKMDTKKATLLEQLQDDQRALKAATNSLAAAPALLAVELALAAAADGQRATATEAKLVECGRKAARAAATLETCLRRLHPWLGDLSDLAFVVAPAEDEISAAETALHDAAGQKDEATRQHRAACEDLERLELEQSQAIAGRRAVSAAELAEARSDRQALWHPLRATLTGGPPPLAPEDAVDAYEAALFAADALADERFEKAEASAKLAALADQITQARLSVKQAEKRCSDADTSRAALQQSWKTRVAISGLPDLSPSMVRQWRVGQAEALEAGNESAAAKAAFEDDTSAVHTARAALLASLPPERRAALAADTPLASVLKAVQALLAEQAEESSRRAVLAAAVVSAQSKHDAAAQRIERQAKEIEDWVPEWRAACTAASLPNDLPWTTLEARVRLFEQLRTAVADSLKMQRRISGIGRRQLAFSAQALGLAATCGVSDPTLSEHALTKALRLRLRSAQQDARARREQEATLAQKRADQREAELAIEAAEAQIAPLMARAQAQDRADLARAIAQAAAERAARADLSALEQAMLADGDGHKIAHLVAEAEGRDPETLAAQADQLDRRIEELDRQIAATAREAGEAQLEFAALDHGGVDAAAAAADAEQARAAMAMEAEAYLVKRAQWVMLKWAMDTYRERQQSPLLARAGVIFATLTGGRYTRLQIDAEPEQPRLVAHCADGANTVTVEGMSDGTADQLYLALRLAALEQSLAAGIVLPFLADDLFINFDDRRAHAGFRVLGEIARKTQVLFFTHHDHLRAIAKDALGPAIVQTCDLQAASVESSVRLAEAML
jgi:uncharacterized protein YhaN